MYFCNVMEAAVSQQTNIFNRKPQTEQMYQDIRRDYRDLSNVKKLGVQFYSTEYIYAKLAEKYYKSIHTIKNIIWHRV